MYNRFRNRFLIALFLDIMAQNADCWALQIHPLVDQQKTEIPVSKDQPNRISVFNDRIQQIFGAEEVDIQTDDDTGQIFVRFLNAAQKEPLTLTIITESGLTQDLKLVPQKIEFQSVLLKPASLEEKSSQTLFSRNERLINLIKAMALGQKIEGYTLTPLKENARQYPKPLRVTPRFAYRAEQEEGYVYRLKNEGDEPLFLSEAVLALPQDLALSLTHTRLEPGQETDLFVVSSKRRAS